ncbi:hypothetical protein B0O99DRAFT_91329 [Bisporella sp. PMI_857]|nr:hypothetical protein B0O99DRAFT_91329 [Bisporella sp. PMI_857]
MKDLVATTQWYFAHLNRRPASSKPKFNHDRYLGGGFDPPSTTSSFENRTLGPGLLLSSSYTPNMGLTLRRSRLPLTSNLSPSLPLSSLSLCLSSRRLLLLSSLDEDEEAAPAESGSVSSALATLPPHLAPPMSACSYLDPFPYLVAHYSFCPSEASLPPPSFLSSAVFAPCAPFALPRFRSPYHIFRGNVDGKRRTRRDKTATVRLNGYVVVADAGPWERGDMTPLRGPQLLLQGARALFYFGCVCELNTPLLGPQVLREVPCRITIRIRCVTSVIWYRALLEMLCLLRKYSMRALT